MFSLALGTLLWLAGLVPGHGLGPAQLRPTVAAAQDVPPGTPSSELPQAPPAPPPEPVVPVAAAAPTPPPAPVQTVRTTQDAALLTPPPPPGTRIARNEARGAGARDPVVPKEKLRDEDDDEAARDPMNWLGLTVRFGYAAVASGSLDNPTFVKTAADAAALLTPAERAALGLPDGSCTPIARKCHTAARSGFQLALSLNIGGGGLGFDLEPYITVGGNAFAVGAYIGPRIQLHLARPFYLGIGFGARAAYVKLDGWKDGGDIFGRIPVSLTYYVAKNFALVLEGAFGAGISLFVSEPVTAINPSTMKPFARVPKIAVGAARGWDITFGLRFP